VSSKTINVDGMTCDHCVNAVTEEISKIPGVTEVKIDLHVGEISQVAINAGIEISYADIAAAVEEAGYSIVPA
jgi:copper chaperone CopZ